MTRGEFAAVPALGALLNIGAQTVAPATQAYVFDRHEFERRAMLPFRHRQVFAARPLAGGVVLHLMANSVKSYSGPNGFGDSANSLHVAAVLYGTSIAALLSDGTWSDLRLPEFLQHLGDLPDANLSVNPYTAVAADLARSNASFFVCNNALHDVASAVSSSLTGGPSAADTYDRLRRGLVPNALVVPAGVGALNALQEYRFTLVQATV